MLVARILLLQCCVWFHVVRLGSVLRVCARVCLKPSGMTFAGGVSSQSETCCLLLKLLQAGLDDSSPLACTPCVTRPCTTVTMARPNCDMSMIGMQPTRKCIHGTALVIENPHPNGTPLVILIDVSWASHLSERADPTDVAFSPMAALLPQPMGTKSPPRSPVRRRGNIHFIVVLFSPTSSGDVSRCCSVPICVRSFCRAVCSACGLVLLLFEFQPGAPIALAQWTNEFFPSISQRGASSEPSFLHRVSPHMPLTSRCSCLTKLFLTLPRQSRMLFRVRLQ